MSRIARMLTGGIGCLWMLASAGFGNPAANGGDTSPPPRDSGLCPIGWARWLARSEMFRQGEAMSHDRNPATRWEYTSALLAHALVILGDATGDEEIRAFGSRIVTSLIQADGSIATYPRDDWNLDMILPGRVVLAEMRVSNEPRYRVAARQLRDQLAQQPRTESGGFWHKRKYPHQMWLDGLYMAAPFLADYASLCGDPSAADECAAQLLEMDHRSYDPASGLFFHGWDEKRLQSWADPANGCSPSFWGRSMGWYAMALVDSLDALPKDHPRADELREVLTRLASGLLRHQDPDSGLWWQVVNQPGRKGNYLESSASAMFCYAMAKAVRCGWLPREPFLSAARAGFDGLVRLNLRRDEGGRISLIRICEVAGLGGMSSKGRPRDGSYGYYIDEPQRDNDPKGLGPFVLAGVELQSFEPGRNGEPSARDPAASVILPRIRDRWFDVSLIPAGSVSRNDGHPLQKAIDECHASGGGRVRVPPGEWQTKPIELKSGVELHLTDGAVLKFSTDPSDYPLVATRWEGVECINYAAMIRASGQSQIAVTGRGTIDGQASAQHWWDWNQKSASPSKQQAGRERLFRLAAEGVPPAERRFGTGSYLRPNLIQFQHCQQVLIEGVRLVRSPMWVIHPVLCQHVTVRGVEVNSHGPNNDGCDPESCQWVCIENSTFDTGDDCIAIKSGRNQDGRRVGVASQEIVVRGCRMRDGHGGVVIGSEVSGGAKRILVEDCEMDSPNLERALRIKTNAMRGGTISQVAMKRVRIGRLAGEVLTVDLLYEEGPKGGWPPVVRDIRLEEVSSQRSPRVMRIEGFEGAVIDGISVENCSFSGLREADIIHHAGSITMRRTQCFPEKLPQSPNRIPPSAR